MTASTIPHNAKGPASAATDPDHGSIESWKGKEMNTRTDITNAATAASVPYTVAQHIQDMQEAGAFFKWSPEGLWQNMLGIDLDAFHAARVRAEEANITTREIWECLEGRELLSLGDDIAALSNRFDHLKSQAGGQGA